MRKISVISGGSSGLGFAIGQKLVESGKNLLILGRDGANIRKAVDQLSSISTSVSVEGLACNIGKEADVSNVGNFIKSNDYEVEYLFNNAGLGIFLRPEEVSSDLIDKTFEANLKGMILLTTEVLRITPKDETLTIVNIMSTSALVGRKDETLYCAAKWGARGYTEALRAEYAGTNRSIIAVFPGGMKTRFWDGKDTTKNIAAFMDPSLVAKKIVDAVLLDGNMVVTDIVIKRK